MLYPIYIVFWLKKFPIDKNKILLMLNHTYLCIYVYFFPIWFFIVIKIIFTYHNILGRAICFSIKSHSFFQMCLAIGNVCIILHFCCGIHRSHSLSKIRISPTNHPGGCVVQPLCLASWEFWNANWCQIYMLPKRKNTTQLWK